MSKELEGIEKLSAQFDSFEKTLGEKADKKEFAEVRQVIDELKKTDTGREANLKMLSESMEKFTTQVEELEEKMRQVRDNQNGPVRQKSFGEAVVDGLRNAGLTKNLGKGERKNIEIEFDVTKAAGTFTTANVDAVGTNSIPFSLSSAEAGLTRVQRRMPWIMDIANVSTINTMYWQWAEQENPDGSAGPTSEGSSKFQIDFDWVEKSRKAEKITGYVKTSRESLEDLAGLQAEINSELFETIMLKADSQLLSGSGTTPQIAGILAQDTAFAAGNLSGTVVDPKFADVIRAAIDQVVRENFVPNYALCHPTDLAQMDLDKSTADGHYLLPPFRSSDGQVISGVRLLANTGQTVGNFTVGDFTKLYVKVRKAFGIDVGYDDDDFTKNLVTILGEIRLLSYIKANHAKAFVSGDYTTAAALLAAS